jgi:hypothetical protein
MGEARSRQRVVQRDRTIAKAALLRNVADYGVAGEGLDGAIRLELEQSIARGVVPEAGLVLLGSSGVG